MKVLTDDRVVVMNCPGRGTYLRGSRTNGSGFYCGFLGGNVDLERRAERFKGHIREYIKYGRGLRPLFFPQDSNWILRGEKKKI